MMKKLGMLIGVLLILCALGAGVLAAEQPAERFHETIPFQVNPLYEGLIDPADFMAEEPAQEQAFSHTQPTFNAAKVTYVSEAEAIEQLRGYMVNRTENFELHFTSKNTNYEPLINEMMMKALDHTGNPTEGDYLAWHFAGWGGSVDWYYDAGIRHYTYVIQVAYYTTADQEKELDTAVSQLLKSLNLSGKSDYEKVCAVYDYIRDNITYDYENLNNPDSWLQYTAYGALINKTAVCQGYANLLYRLLLELGIDNRIITGETLEGPHAWNIVKLGDVYYNVDATWDAILGDHDYFLKNSIGFLDHARHMDYATTQFHTEYPMSETDYVDGVEGVPEHVIAWGICGEEVYWAIDRDGVLTIGGIGPMLDLPANEPALWDYWADGFDTVVIEEGITSVGKYAFYGLTNIVEVQLPKSVLLVDDHAFNGCCEIQHLGFAEGLERIGEGAFYEVKKMEKLQLPTTVREIGVYAFGLWTALEEIVFPQGLETIQAFAFVDCINLKEIEIPGSVTYLSGFADCINLEKVQLHNTGEIGIEAFSNCDRLEEIVIPEGVTKIGHRAFADCNMLSKITIPSTVTYITGFENCLGLTTVQINSADGVIDEDAFMGCISLAEVMISEGITQIGENAFMGCHGLRRINIPGSVAVIGDRAFYECLGLKEVTISEGVTQIGYEAFRECLSLRQITIPESVISIGDGAFKDCYVLQTVCLKNTGSVGDFTFNSCYALENLIIEGKVTSIGSHTFFGCNKVTRVIFPESITYLGENAFSQCEALAEVVFLGDAPQMESTAFHFNTIVAYYPTDNPSWTEDVMQQYGGTITWLPDNSQIPEEPEVIPGDINCDGKVNNKDASCLFQYLSGWDVEVDEARLDINADGKVNNKDASRLFQYLSGWDVEIA